MPEDATIDLEVDAQLLRKMEMVCAALGLPVADALTVFMRKTVEEGRLPFEPEEEELP